MVGVSRGGCRMCHKTVPGRPGEWAVCMHCGTQNLIPAEDVVVVPPPPPRSVAASPLPAQPARTLRRSPAGPRIHHVSRPPRRPLRIPWAWIFVLTLVAIAIGAGATNIDKILPRAPTVAQVQHRWDVWDPSGHGLPFTMETLWGATANSTSLNFTRTVDLAGKESTLFVDGRLEHAKGDLTLRVGVTGTQLVRHWTGWTLVPSDQFRFVNNSGRTYYGTTGGRPFQLTLDKSGRFDALRYAWPSGRLAATTYTYEDPAWPVIRPDALRGAADVPLTSASLQKSDIHFKVNLFPMEDAVRPEELQFTFYDFTDVPIEATSFGTPLNKSGFLFKWTDQNSNGLVDQGDVYEYQFPKSVAHVRIFDEWAHQRVDPKQRLPSLEDFLGALAKNQ